MKISPVRSNVISKPSYAQNTNKSFKGSYGSGVKVAVAAAKASGLSAGSIFGIFLALLGICAIGASKADEMYRDMSERDKDDFTDYLGKSQIMYG